MIEFQWAVERLTTEAMYLARYAKHISYRVDPDERARALRIIEQAREQLAVMERAIKEGTDK